MVMMIVFFYQNKKKKESQNDFPNCTENWDANDPTAHATVRILQMRKLLPPPES